MTNSVDDVPEGDFTHPNHDAWIYELGHVLNNAARLQFDCANLLRVLTKNTNPKIFDDTLGELRRRLTAMMNTPSPPSPLPAFLDALDDACAVRNEIMHAHATGWGLAHETTAGRKTWTTIADLHQVNDALVLASRLSGDVLYHDGGLAFQEWIGRSD